MNQYLRKETRISVVFLCLNSTELKLLLSAMNTQSIQLLIQNLHSLSVLTRFDCEAALMDFLELINNEQNTSIQYKHIERLLSNTLEYKEAVQIIQEITVDTQRASRLLFSITKYKLTDKNIRQSMEILSGIRQRLLNANHVYNNISFDHFTSEMIAKASRHIQLDPKKIALIIENYLENSKIPLPLKKRHNNGRKKTAIVMLQFEVRYISQIFEHLANVEKQAIAFEMKCLGKISAYELGQSLSAYMDNLIKLKLIEDGQTEFVYSLLDQIHSLHHFQDDSESMGNEDLFFDSSRQPPRSQQEIYKELVGIAQKSIQNNPRLVARAIRHMFRQDENSERK